MKFRKKPVVIEAIRWGGSNIHELNEMAFDASSNYWREADKLAIKTLEGTMVADVGDYIIKGIKGELYPCKPDIFAASYEPA